MKKIAIMFAALCVVALVSQESFAQCGGGGGGYYRGGGGSYGGSSFYRSTYRPNFGVNYHSYSRPSCNTYRPRYIQHHNYHRPYYGSYYRGGTCGRGVSIRF